MSAYHTVMKHGKLLSTKDRKARVSLMRRGFAFLIDWYVGSVLCALPIMVLYQVLRPQEFAVMDIRLFPFPYAIMAVGTALLCAVLYYIIIPYNFNGVTLGKKAMGLCIKEEGKIHISWISLTKRQLTIILIEGSIYSITSFLWQIVCYSTPSFQQYITWLYYGITLISIIMVVFKRNGKALHDYIGRTTVIYTSSRKETK